MNRKRGIFAILLIIFLLGVIDSAWILSINRTITANIIGTKTNYSITQEFSNSLSINTSNSASAVNTTMKVRGLSYDLNMTLDIHTERTSLVDSNCSDYKEDCNVTLTQIASGTRYLLTKKQNVDEHENFTLYKNTDNIFEYNILCIRNSCAQTITSIVKMTQI